MKAAILVEQKQPLVIEDIELPKTLNYGQVLVRVICSGVCGSQLGEIDGVKGVDKFLPHLLGHEGGGIVEKVGPGVSKVKPGDHVVMHWRKGAGIESEVPVYQWGKHAVNAGWVTTFNEYAVVSENRVTTIPNDLDFETAALLGCAVTTGLGVVNNEAKLKIGESIVVFGVGSVGMNIVQGASLVSANPIIAIDIHDHKLEQARQFGATHVINSSQEDVISRIHEIVGSKGADVVIDNTGNVSVIETAYEVTSAKGRTILVGVPKIGNKVSIYTLPLHFDKKFFGSCGGECCPSVDIPNYLKLIQNGTLKVKDMITHRYDLKDINTALEDARNGKIGKCLINIAK